MVDTNTRTYRHTHTHAHTPTDTRSSHAISQGGNNPLPLGTGRTLRIRQKLKMLQICNPYSKDVEFFTYRCGAIQTEYTHRLSDLHSCSIPVTPPGRPTLCVTYLFKFYFLRVLLPAAVVVAAFVFSLYFHAFIFHICNYAGYKLFEQPAGRTLRQGHRNRERERKRKREGNWEQEPTNL